MPQFGSILAHHELRILIDLDIVSRTVPSLCLSLVKHCLLHMFEERFQLLYHGHLDFELLAVVDIVSHLSKEVYEALLIQILVVFSSLALEINQSH